MEERRKYIRTNGLVLVNYKIAGLDIDGKSSAFDVSGSGVRITVDKQVACGSPVEMEIYLPGDSQPILAKGDVVWVQKCREKAASQMKPDKEYFYTGIKFTILDEKNKNRIINYVTRKIHY